MKRPLPKAPPFGTLHLYYPVEQLAESLAEGIKTMLPRCPEFQLDSAQIADVIAYLKSLEHPSFERIDSDQRITRRII